MDFENDIVNCLDVLQRGGLILYPTDTIWGIGCDATSAEAVAKVYALKQRAAAKSMIVLMAEERDVLKYTSQPDLRVFDYLQTVVKPTTVIYEGAIGLAENLVNEDGTVGVRLVREDFCRHLIKRWRKPLVSTSANISGEAAPRFFREIDSRVREGVDYIVEYRRDDETPREASAVVKWNADATVTVIRP
ncbi:MAG: Sua5/YciO/YrdC/YwlC family protein [Bacteroidetes bacterium]|nr:Sua5/YciO/YrdC/YwlC family protein [Bacteroidota bacterium]